MAATAEQLTTRFGALLVETRAAVMAHLLTLWRRLDADHIDAAYPRIEAAAQVMLTASLTRVAAAAPLYLAGMLTAGGLDGEPQPLNVAAFAASTIDGRPLRVIPRSGLVTVKSAIRAGAPAAQALTSGYARVARGAATEVLDVGREALSASMILEDHVQQYERTLRLPSCSRCFSLAGIRSDVGTAFQRHPRCDCFQRPVIHRTPPRTAKNLWPSLSREQQDQMLGPDAAQRVRDGASIASVARASFRNGGMSVRTTVDSPARITPLAIREASHGDPQEYRRLMVANGFLLT